MRVLYFFEVQCDSGFCSHVVVLLVAILSKIVGCGIPAAFFLKDPDKGLRVGVGMASRGEVGPIIAGIGISTRVIPSDVYTALITVVLATTLLGPIMLRKAFTSHPLSARVQTIRVRLNERRKKPLPPPPATPTPST